ncbi:MAG: type IV pili methyl-accepting chemotaxis transducer N-terminal domain-containing protein [Rubrivivax sp.]|nr:type IV pili methyl-accepting chemotaxis transducer N-terminal domain-containing protein [Rubrivivax sp.]
MRLPRTLRGKLGAIGGALLLLALTSIGLTLWVSWQLEGGAAAVNEAGRMRMQTWRMAHALSEGDRELVQALARRFDASVALLRNGDPSRPLFAPRDTGSQAAFDDVQRGWTGLRAAWTAPQAPAPALARAQAEQFVARVDAFVDAIEARLAHWTSVLNLFQMAMFGIVVASAVTLLYAATLFVFNPLARLQAALARVRAGDLGARVEPSSDDEFGALADGFNRMAETLQGLYGSLEAKVRSKTLHLEAERARLAALYEAAAFVARADTLDELAQGFARQVRVVARADASAIRWSDERNERYLMLASDCLPQQLLDGEHCIPTGDCLCGQPRGDATTRVIAIRAEGGGGQGLLGHCERAGYETVVGVPVQLHDRLVGELNLFYRSAAVLSDDDRNLLEALASHLAGAIESQRAGALQREAAVAEERSLLARELHDSIAQGLSFLKIQTALLRGALDRGDQAQAAKAVAELDAGVRESLSDVRELLMHFRTRTNHEDIEPALRTTLRKFEHQTGLATHLSLHGQGLPLPPDVQVQVLHVVQEALSNVRKHAGASAVWVDVQQTPRWRVRVRDDGRGIDAARARPDETHVGLRIMRERAARIGAEVAVLPAPGGGTEVVLTLPSAPATAEGRIAA